MDPSADPSQISAGSRGCSCMGRENQTVFACQVCGHVERKWSGRCSQCGAWSSFVEERSGGGGGERSPLRAVGGGPSRGSLSSSSLRGERPAGKAVRITDV